MGSPFVVIKREESAYYIAMSSHYSLTAERFRNNFSSGSALFVLPFFCFGGGAAIFLCRWCCYLEKSVL